MKRAWLVLGALSALWIGGNYALAESPELQDSVWGVMEPVYTSVTLTTPTLTGPVTITGATTSSGSYTSTGAIASTLTGDKVVFDNNGLQGAWPTTDIAPDILRIFAASASPVGSGTTTGANLVLSGGNGSATFVLTVSNCGAADTVTINMSNDNTANVCTRDATTTAAVVSHAGTFVCGATNQAMAVNVATCLNGVSGIQACAGSACTLFTGVDGTVYVYKDTADPSTGTFALTSSGNHAVAATGTTGAVVAMQSIVLRSSAGAGNTDDLTISHIRNNATLGDFYYFGDGYLISSGGFDASNSGSTGWVASVNNGGMTVAAGFGYRFSDGTAHGAISAQFERTTSGTIGVYGATLSTSGILWFRMQEATKTGTYTTLFTDCNETLNDLTDGAVVTLILAATAQAGCQITLRNTAAAGAALIQFTAATNDTICGTVGAVTSTCGATNSWKNTKVTAQKGDYTTLRSDGVTTWWIVGGVGVWSN